MLALPVAASDETLSEIRLLKEQMKVMQKRIEVLEAKALEDARKQEKVKKTPIADTTGTSPMQQRGMIELTDADTILTFGGRIQLDTAYSNPDVSYYGKNIPVPAQAGEAGEFRMSARESRLWFKTRTPSDWGMIRTLIETDFKGSSGTEINSNGHGPRLRHAYMDINGLSLGQTNSVFNAYVTLDSVLTVINDTLVRQPLIRYSHSGKTWGYDLSLEQPETTLLDPDGIIITPQDDRFPDIGARVRYYPAWGETAVAAVARYITHNRALLSDTTQTALRDSALGWGVNASGKIKIGENDDIRFDAQYGKGIGRYLAYNAFAAASIDTAGNISLIESYGGHLGYRHWWNEQLRSTLAAAYIGTDNPAGVPTDITKEVRSLQANLMWTPVDHTLFSFEYSKAIRELENGDDNELELLQLTVRYNF
jgi:hypothetical protein